MTTSTNFDDYRRRLAAAAGRASPDRETEARMLVGELRAAHKRAIALRDKAAAGLHYHHGWTVTSLCVAIHGRPNKVTAVREAIESAPRPPRLSKRRAEEAFQEAQRDVKELWALYKQAKALGTESSTDGAGSELELDLPSDPRARAVAAAEQLEALAVELKADVEARNRAAAALTVYAGWPKRSAAALARAAVRDLYPHEKAASKSEADPRLVAEKAEAVRRRTTLKAALVRARDEAIRELTAENGESEPPGGRMRPADVARLVNLTDERIVQIRGAGARGAGS